MSARSEDMMGVRAIVASCRLPIYRATNPMLPSEGYGLVVGIRTRSAAHFVNKSCDPCWKGG